MYKTTILIRKGELENFRKIASENNIKITNEEFCERDYWYPCDSYNMTVSFPLEINIIETLQKNNLYDGITITGLDGKDEGLYFHLN